MLKYKISDSQSRLLKKLQSMHVPRIIYTHSQYWLDADKNKVAERIGKNKFYQLKKLEKSGLITLAINNHGAFGRINIKVAPQ